MYALAVIAVAVRLASADVGLGYNYKPPPNTGHISGSSSILSSYGLPSYPISGNPGYYNAGYNSASGIYKGFVPQTPQGYKIPYEKYQSSSNQQAGYQGVTHLHTSGHHHPSAFGTYQSGVSSGSGVNSAAAIQGGSSNIGFSPLNHYHQSNQYQGSYQKYQEVFPVQQQPVQIFKHFYVHAAPDDEEPPKPRNPIVLPPPQKHYKIIFIKTPAQPVSAPQIIPVPQQNEEKTIVYVLVKKPEEAENIVLPKVEQIPPPKPEVFFIKYNNKEGSRTVIDNIVKDYNKGQSVSFVNTGESDASSSSSIGSTYYPAPTVSTSASSVTGDTSIPSEFALPSFSFSGGSSVPFASSGFGTGVIGTTDGTSGSATHISPGFESQPISISTGEISDGTTSETAGSGTASASSVSSGFENNASDTASTAHAIPLSTSQGVPHENYGTPKFRD